MTAASVLSLCMFLIARSPPDSSRSPHKLSPPLTPPHPGRRATNIAAPAATASSVAFVPTIIIPFATGALRGPRNGSARMHRRANTRGHRNTAAGMSPLRPPIPHVCSRRQAPTRRPAARDSFRPPTLVEPRFRLGDVGMARPETGERSVAARRRASPRGQDADSARNLRPAEISRPRRTSSHASRRSRRGSALSCAGVLAAEVPGRRRFLRCASFSPRARTRPN
jgi:hypothetical protein